MQYLAHRAGETIPRADINEHTYQDYGDTGSNRLDVCVSALRKKLNAGELPDLISTRRGLGFVLGGERR